MRIILNIWFSLIIISSVSCNTEETDNTVCDRIIIAYLIGTAELKGDIELKIKALQKGMTRVDAKHNRIIICAETPDSGLQILELSDKGLVKINTYDLYSSVTLKDVTNSIMQYYKANTYGVIVFSHSDYGYIFKDTRHESDISEFVASLPFPLSGKYEFIIFESCFMSCIEMAYQLRGKTKYMIGSCAEIISPGYSECYASQLYLLFAEKPLLEQFANTCFLKCAEKEGIHSSATISVLDITRITSLVCDICELYKLSNSDIPLCDVQTYDRRNNHFFYDLGDLIGKIPVDSLSDFNKSLSDVVVYANSTECFMNSFIIKSHCGINTFTTSQIFNDSLLSVYSSLDYCNMLRMSLKYVHH